MGFHFVFLFLFTIFLIIFSEIIPFNGNKDNSFFINLFLEVIFSYSAIFQFKLLSKNWNYILILFLIINIIFNVIPFIKSIISMMKDETNLKEIHVILEIFVFLYSNHLL